MTTTSTASGKAASTARRKVSSCCRRKVLIRVARTCRTSIGSCPVPCSSGSPSGAPRSACHGVSPRARAAPGGRRRTCAPSVDACRAGQLRLGRVAARSRVARRAQGNSRAPGPRRGGSPHGAADQSQGDAAAATTRAAERGQRLHRGARATAPPRIPALPPDQPDELTSGAPLDQIAQHGRELLQNEICVDREVHERMARATSDSKVPHGTRIHPRLVRGQHARVVARASGRFPGTSEGVLT